MITDMLRLYRWLVAGNIVCFTIWVAYLWLTPPLIPYDMLTSWGHGPTVNLPASVSWLLDLLNVFSLLGLMGFVRDARWLFIAVTALQYGITPFDGAAVSTAFENSLGNIVTLLDGAVIVLSFVPTVSEQFNRSPSN
jgi:hypothetical protein